MIPSIIDIEASGFGRGSYPIEIGYILSDGNRYCSLVTPEPGWEFWDNEAEKIHGISRDMLFKYGKPAKVVAEHLNKSLRDKILYSDGWNHDFSWLGFLYNHVELEPFFKLETIRAIMSEKQMELWHGIKDKVTEELSTPRHRASTDAMIIQKTYHLSFMTTKP